MSAVNSEVVSEIYKAMEKLGAGSDLLGIVGSWGDSLPESQVLSMLRGWNGRTAGEAQREAAHEVLTSIGVGRQAFRDGAPRGAMLNESMRIGWDEAEHDEGKRP
jgi:hypothetical protein